MEIIRLLKRMIYPAMLPALLLFSCKKETQNTDTNQPIVQAYLIPGKAISVNVHSQKSLTDTSTYGPPINGLKLYISDGTTKVSLTETSKGVYTYADTTFLVTGKTYSLSFNYNSVVISAKTTIPAKPKGFTTLYSTVNYTTADASTDTLNRFTWQNPDSLNHVLVFNNSDGTIAPVNSFGGGAPNFEVDTRQKSVYYVLPQIFSYYGHYEVILFSVNQEYINLLKSNAASANSQNLLNAPTNIVNGFGIFTAMQSDTVKFDFL